MDYWDNLHHLCLPQHLLCPRWEKGIRIKVRTARFGQPVFYPVRDQKLPCFPGIPGSTLGLPLLQDIGYDVRTKVLPRA